MDTNLVRDSKAFRHLEPFIGKVVSVDDFGDGVVTGDLGIFSVPGGKEGWTVGDPNDPPYMIFAADLVERVEVFTRADTCKIWLSDPD